MSFLTPGAGWLALLAIPVILCYLLKVRLKREPVSTMIFWRDVFQERRHRQLWRRLRYWLSLLIALLLVALTVLSLANPILSKKEARPTVILFDRSASMGGIDPATRMSRLDEAKSMILSMIPADQTEAEMTVVDFGATPEIAVGFTRCGRTLRRAIEKIAVTDESTALAEGIDFARKLTVGRPGAQILAVTDGADPRWPDLLKTPNVAILPVGAPLDNVGITRFQPRRSLTDATGYEILVVMENFGASPVTCRLEIDLDDSAVDVIPITLEPNKPETRIVRSVSEEGGTLRGTLHLDGTPKGADALASDNVATGILPAKPLQRILLYGPPDFFLSHVFASQQHVAVESISEIPSVVPKEGVLVLHGPVPKKIPSGDVILIDPVGTSDLFRVGDALDAPLIATTKEDSPLLRFVPLTNVAVPGAKKIEVLEADSSEGEGEQLTEKASPTDQTESLTDKTSSSNAAAALPDQDSFPVPTVLAETPEGAPICLQWNGPGRKVVLLSADPSQGDLALRTSFPILIANALTWFRGDGGEMTESTDVLSGLEGEGNLRSAGPEFYETARSGLSEEFRPERPLWFWFAAVVFFLMIVEWFLYHRRWID